MCMCAWFVCVCVCVCIYAIFMTRVGYDTRLIFSLDPLVFISEFYFT